MGHNLCKQMVSTSAPETKKIPPNRAKAQNGGGCPEGILLDET
jgi:hypothetical protein